LLSICLCPYNGAAKVGGAQRSPAGQLVAPGTDHSALVGHIVEAGTADTQILGRLDLGGPFSSVNNQEEYVVSKYYCKPNSYDCSSPGRLDLGGLGFKSPRGPVYNIYDLSSVICLSHQHWIQLASYDESSAVCCVPACWFSGRMTTRGGQGGCWRTTGVALLSCTVQVGTEGYCSPRHQTHFEPSFLELKELMDIAHHVIVRM
jgi:hypothetical protein